MTARPDRASRLRLTLKSLLAECQQQLHQLLPLRQLVKGSVYELQTRCGKPSCHCASDQGPLHTSIVLSWSEKGRTRLQTLPPGERAHLRQLTENYRRFRQARAALVKLQRRMLATLDQLEKTLRLPPPKPASRRRRR
ncbi:MAG: hypothetical protein EHM39_02525 [Chloroflexi bacterium]|nr:MAG: hypothetical protein EHM39_02525 [Chloroflexota bacterium]